MSEAVWQRLAWALPRPLVKWAAIRLAVHAIEGPDGAAFGDLTVADALTRWETP